MHNIKITYSATTFNLLAIFLMLSPVKLFSQTVDNENILEITIKQRGAAYRHAPHFYKAQNFFLEKSWDSTLVYSMKQLNAKLTGEVADYCHYFRAISFTKKKLLDEAKKEFNAISTGFDFYYKVKLSLGEIFLEQQEYNNAISSFREIYKLKDSIGYGFKYSAVLHNLGLCYLHLGKFKLAESFLFQGLARQKYDKDTLLEIGSYMDIGTLYYEQYRDKEAIGYFVKAYALSKKVKDFEIKQNAAVNMAIVEENRGRFLDAVNYRKEYERWKDSLNNQNKIWELAELEKRFAVKQQQKELNRLVAENKLKKFERNVLIYTSVALFLFLSASLYVYRQKVRTGRIILSQKSELDQLNASKDKLFSIVSHDLRSSVSALKLSNTKLLDNLECSNYKELDVLLHNNSVIAHSAYNLLDNLLNWALLQTTQPYFKIEAIRLYYIIEHVVYNYKPLMLNKNISFANTIPKDVFVFADTESLKIIFRNLLDNAIKFCRKNGAILLHIDTQTDFFYNVAVKDEGCGMNEITRQELLKDTVLFSKKRNEDVGTGLGLQLCKSLIAKNHGMFSIESKQHEYTKIIVSLPKSLKNA